MAFLPLFAPILALTSIHLSQHLYSECHSDDISHKSSVTSSSWHHLYRPCINWISHSWRNFSTICIKFDTNVVQTICSKSQVTTECYVHNFSDVICAFLVYIVTKDSLCSFVRSFLIRSSPAPLPPSPVSPCPFVPPPPPRLFQPFDQSWSVHASII